MTLKMIPPIYRSHHECYCTFKGKVVENGKLEDPGIGDPGQELTLKSYCLTCSLNPSTYPECNTPGFELAQTLEAASIDLTAFFLPFSIIGSPKNLPQNCRKRDFHINRQFCMYIIGEAQLANFTYLFTLDGNSFVRENLNIINQMTVGKNFSGAAK